MKLLERVDRSPHAVGCHHRDRSFAVLREHPQFVLLMALGSIAGALAGGLLLGVAPADFLLPVLAAILALSAVKPWPHQ